MLVSIRNIDKNIIEESLWSPWTAIYHHIVLVSIRKHIVLALIRKHIVLVSIRNIDKNIIEESLWSPWTAIYHHRIFALPSFAYFRIKMIIAVLSYLCERYVNSCVGFRHSKDIVVMWGRVTDI